MSQELTNCPICHGGLRKKKVDKILRGGQHTAIISVDAQVCMHCGERIYTPETIRRFETIREQLQNQDVGTFEAIGQTFQIH